MKKRLLSLLLATAAIFCLSACNGKDSEETTLNPEESTSSQALAEQETTSEPLTFSEEEAEQLKALLGEDAVESYIEDETVPVTMAISDELIDGEEKEIEVELDSSGKPSDSVVEKSFTDILKSGNYTAKYILSSLDENGKSVTGLVPLTIVSDGESVYMEVSMSADTGSVRGAFLFSPDGSYAIVPAMKAYIAVEGTGLTDDFSEMFGSIDQLENEQTDGNSYVSTTEVTFNGETYICETYENEGSVSKYYSQNNDIRRIELISDDGYTTIVEIEEISPKADASKLKLPAGYIDITSLMSDSTNWEDLVG